MSTIRPFKAIRPRKEYAGIVASKPYDVLNTEEAKLEAVKYSFLHIEKSEIDFPNTHNPYDKWVYDKARENLLNFQKEGVLFKEAEDIFYIYAQTMQGRTQYGVVACASVDEYQKDIIKKHEFTRKDKEEDRMNHILTASANTGLVFLTYPDHEGVNKLVSKIIKNKKEYDFVDSDSVRHEVWLLNNKEDINQIQNYFKTIPALYVADGHHRSASASKIADLKKSKNPNHTGQEEYNFFSAVFFPASQMLIMDYNRLVKDLNGLNYDEYMGKLSEKFDIKESKIAKPSASKNIGMYLNSKWYALTAKSGSYPASDPVNSLDVAILQNNVLSPILGIGDPRTDKRIDFVGGLRGIKELEKRVNSGEYKIAFAMYPTNINELISVADAGLTMPPKSTWFEPKLKSGLFTHELD